MRWLGENHDSTALGTSDASEYTVKLNAPGAQAESGPGRVRLHIPYKAHYLLNTHRLYPLIGYVLLEVTVAFITKLL